MLGTRWHPAPVPRNREDGGPGTAGRIGERRVRVTVGILLPLLAVAAIFGFRWWHFYHTYVSTDDAYLEAPVVLVSSSVPGHVTAVLVRDNETVQRGTLLLRLDSGVYRDRVAQAHAALDQAKLKQKAVKPAGARVRQAARDAVTAARAALDAARQELDATRVYAAADGRIEHLTARPGSNVQAGQPVMALVESQRWVVARFKETQIARLHVGQPVDLHVDAYPGLVLPGRVASLQAGTDSPYQLIPPQNADSNYVKVVQRVPVRIELNQPPDPKLDLGPGMSVVPYVQVGR